MNDKYVCRIYLSKRPGFPVHNFNDILQILLRHAMHMFYFHPYTHLERRNSHNID